MTDSFDIFRRGENIEWPGSTNDSWVVRLQHGDNTAWEQLLELYAPAVFRWCRRLGVDGEDVVDVAQEVLVGASQGIHQFLVSDDSSFRGWLWTLTRNRAIDCLRRQRRGLDALGGAAGQGLLEQATWHDRECFDGEDASDSSVSGDEGGQSQTLRLVLEALQPRFREKTWQAFFRTVVGEEEPEHVASELEMSVNSVYLARSRILRLLRDEISGSLNSR